MPKATTRAKRDEQPPSTSGTSTRRARRWPVAGAMLAVGLIAAVAQVAAADPLAEPVKATTPTATAARVAPARPAKAVAQAPRTNAFANLGDIALVSAATASRAAGGLDVTPPPPPPPPPRRPPRPRRLPLPPRLRPRSPRAAAAAATCPRAT
jgi:hypothetical protein